MTKTTTGKRDISDFETITVYSVTRGFESGKLKYRVTPFRFDRKNGESHKITRIRQCYRDKKGSVHYLHYVITTYDKRIFHIAWVSSTQQWYLVNNVEDELMFDEFGS